MPLRRHAGLWLVLMAAYAATLGLHASDGSRYTAAEAHRLLTTDSIVHDGDLDLTNQYRERAWRDWYPHVLHPTAGRTGGRLVEPQGIGLPALYAPGYAIGAATGAEVESAILMALAFVLAAALARRLVPDPWATGAALAVGVSPPVLVAATGIGPSAAGAALLTGAALLALRVRERPRLRWTFWCAALVALAPWLSVRLIVPAAVLALALARWLRRRQRGLAGFVALEVLLTSTVVYITVNDRLFGGLVPAAARNGPGTATGASSVADYVDRVPRLLAAWVDRDVGLLRWAPVFALTLWGAWLLWRSYRGRLSVALGGQVDVEVTAALSGLVVLSGLGVAAFAERRLHGAWLVLPDLVTVAPFSAALAAWGLRHAPRTGAVLVTLTLAASGWLLLGARLDDGAGLSPPHGPLPWAGAQRILPRF